MKAYQLKMMIQSSDISDYCRCIIPYGITFSQFSTILNEIIGGHQRNIFTFEFYEKGIFILEKQKEMGEFDIDFYEASTTIINKFIENSIEFYYMQDGEKRKHKVVVENILQDYYKNYPEVLEYHQNKKQKDKQISLFHTKDAVNQLLQQQFQVIYKRGESRTQKEIYFDLEKGKNGLIGLEKKEELWKENKAYEMQLEQNINSLIDVYHCYTKQDIIEILKMHGIRGYSGYGKSDLVIYAVESLLKPEIMERFFSCLRDDEIEAFKTIIKGNGVYRIDDVRLYGRILDAGYCGLHGLEFIDIPNDVIEAYRKIEKGAFHKKRKYRSFLLDCFQVAGVLYGVAPLFIISKIFQQKFKLELTDDKIISEMKDIPEFLYEFIISENLCIHKSLLEGNVYKYLQLYQGDRGFYIPTLKEIESYVKTGYFSDDEVLKEFILYMKTEWSAFEGIAEIAGALIQQAIGFGCQIEDIYDILEEQGIEIKNNRQRRKMEKLITKLYEDTRLIVNRGHKETELRKKEKREDNIIEFKSMKERKIYPNDFCPCGSGEKFKDCCRKKIKN